MIVSIDVDSSIHLWARMVQPNLAVLEMVTNYQIKKLAFIKHRHLIFDQTPYTLVSPRKTSNHQTNIEESLLVMYFAACISWDKDTLKCDFIIETRKSSCVTARGLLHAA